jgi:hypothetical protein
VEPTHTAIVTTTTGLARRQPGRSRSRVQAFAPRSRRKPVIRSIDAVADALLGRCLRGSSAAIIIFLLRKPR